MTSSPTTSWPIWVAGAIFLGAAVIASVSTQSNRSGDSLSIANEDLTLVKTNADESKPGTERAVLAGGCFWGMEDLFRKQPGVLATRVGYTGGDIPNATYRNHGNHAEAIEVIYDPSKTNYRKMLEFFFQVHDPTTKNRQGNDIGASYRSAIYYTSDEQKAVAEDTIADVNASGLWPGKVVTQVEPVGDFWEAEPEHQDYLVRNPRGYTCHYPRKNWVLPRRDSKTPK
ncbi:peptide-methionine (S)-S-oxide reductase MsrA [Neorhodopirellula pilleata]|uniref:Peptide methionine sulfoxide reductase MsrA n=1 Tax=Neorhodopirellula pilleata TaxID=2714738 RepID=A0A5C5ZFE4_9BACT|nr:peptide-methionine (S)-S-oxide reductase MsrA [Neorhodopirellula pilleata]TWT86052.1 Peptide methionine sulfoxide reductase MsrA 3 [Neorhodopirellula pilleata]